MKSNTDYISISEDQYDINLNNNETYIDIDKNILMKMKSALMDVQLHKYPSDDMSEIKSLYAKYAGCNSENIIVGNGSIECLELAISTIIKNNGKALTFNPDFNMYDFFVSRFGGTIKKYNIDCNKNTDIDEVIKCCKEENVDLIIFSNPNDPTGMLIECEDILKLLEELKDKMIIVDESYYEFCGKSAISYINKYKNLIITRTLSKAWGLAGLRVGFLLTNKDNIDGLLKNKVPYTLDSYTQQIAKILLKYPNKILENTNKIIEQRENLFKELREIQKNAAMNIKFYPSQGNYIYGKTEYKEALIRGLKDRKIIIRDLEDNNFRIAVGSPLENKKLVEGIKKIFMY